MQGLIDFFIYCFHWVFALVQGVLKSFFNLLSDLVCWIVEQFLDLAVMLLEALSFDALVDISFSDHIAALPAQLLNIFWLVGAPGALSIVTTAYVIRLFLQFIPFTRLGS